MRKTTFCELTEKEVINCCDGRRFGYPVDCEIDIECGRIISLIVKENCRRFEFYGKEKQVIIPWEKIEKIGDDLIIVNFECPLCSDEPRRERRGFFG